MYNADKMLLLKGGLYQHYTWRVIPLHSLCIKQVAGKFILCIMPVVSKVKVFEYQHNAVHFVHYIFRTLSTPVS